MKKYHFPALLVFLLPAALDVASGLAAAETEPPASPEVNAAADFLYRLGWRRGYTTGQKITETQYRLAAYVENDSETASELVMVKS